MNPFNIGSTTHTFLGSVLVCIPAGLLFLVLFYAMRKPLWSLLPARHRHAVAPLVTAPLSVDARFVLVAAVSVLLGAWTHIAWDSFTHRGTWIFSRLALLREPWINFGPVEFPGYSVLQHLSTLVGTAGLGLAYFLWLRRQPRAHFNEVGDGWRYLVIISAPIVAFGFAILLALRAAVGPAGLFDARAFVFKTAVFGMSALISLLFLYSSCYYTYRFTSHKTGPVT